MVPISNGTPMKGDIVLAHFPHVFEIRRLQKRVDSRPMRQFPALEATDLGFVFDGIDAFEAEFFSAADLLFPLPRAGCSFSS